MTNREIGVAFGLLFLVLLVAGFHFITDEDECRHSPKVVTEVTR